MKRYAVIAMIIALYATAASAEITREKAVEKARVMVKELGMGLKQNLQRAMKKGGPVKAIPVCKSIAQSKAKSVSKKHGALIHRVSLKLRNPANAPDMYETEVLRQMEADLAANALKPEYVFVEEKNGSKNLRFMKPIVTSQVCMKCHGAIENIDPKVIEILGKDYPEDMATGYGVKMVRGAFSVVYPMD